MSEKDETSVLDQMLAGVNVRDLLNRPHSFRGQVLPPFRRVQPVDYFHLVKNIAATEGPMEFSGCDCLPPNWQSLRYDDMEGISRQVSLFVPAPIKFLGHRHLPLATRQHCGSSMIFAVCCTVLECQACRMQVLEITPTLRLTRNKHVYEVDMIFAEMCTACEKAYF
jgi:hypothetical protein